MLTIPSLLTLVQTPCIQTAAVQVSAAYFGCNWMPKDDRASDRPQQHWGGRFWKLKWVTVECEESVTWCYKGPVMPQFPNKRFVNPFLISPLKMWKYSVNSFEIQHWVQHPRIQIGYWSTGKHWKEICEGLPKALRRGFPVKEGTVSVQARLEDYSGQMWVAFSNY